MSDEPHIPDSLKQALRSRIAPETQIPGALDEAILRDARTHLLRRRPWRAWIGAAAAIVLTGTVVWVGLSNPQPDSMQITMDVNRDQQINILDALSLARQGGAPADEIDAIVAASVKLEDQP